MMATSFATNVYTARKRVGGISRAGARAVGAEPTSRPRTTPRIGGPAAEHASGTIRYLQPDPLPLRDSPYVCARPTARSHRPERAPRFAPRRARIRWSTSAGVGNHSAERIKVAAPLAFDFGAALSADATFPQNSPCSRSVSWSNEIRRYRRSPLLAAERNDPVSESHSSSEENGSPASSDLRKTSSRKDFSFPGRDGREAKTITENSPQIALCSFGTSAEA